MQIEELYKIYEQHPSVQTDTRKLKQGDLFVALKGPNFDGNSFARQALDSGASYAIIDDKACEIPGKTILVENSLDSLQQLASFHRKKFTCPVIAITGSNGKTTTKELIHSVLSTSYSTYTTEGNLNNHIGVPLTLLKIKPGAEMVIIEMGANHLGEIASYCRIALPDHGLITNCGKAHLEGFGSEEGVRRGKGELFDHLRSLTHGFAFVNWDYGYLREMSKGISGIIKYGTGDEAHVIGQAKQTDPFLAVDIIQGMDEKQINTSLIGDYNLPNILAAVTVGKFFKVRDSNIKQAIEGYTPSNSRSQLVTRGTNRFILDAYNANPSSMKLAIENFARMPGKNKVLLLGAMAELGAGSMQEHESIIKLIDQYQWNNVVLVGGEFLRIKNNYLAFDSSVDAATWLIKQNFDNTTFLVKGSRSTQMEKILE